MVSHKVCKNSTCDNYKLKEKERILSCESTSKTSLNPGVEIITYFPEKQLSVLRFVSPLNGGYITISSVIQTSNKNSVLYIGYKIKDIIKTLKFK